MNWQPGTAFDSSAYAAYMQAALQLCEQEQKESLHASINEKLWGDLFWHIKEAKHLNELPNKMVTPIVRRLARNQGRINRMLLIAVELLARTQIHMDHQLQSCLRLARSSLASNAIASDTQAIIHSLNEARHHHQNTRPGYIPLYKRLSRNQYGFNAGLHRALGGSIAAATSIQQPLDNATTTSHSRENTELRIEAWKHLNWHCQQMDAMNRSHAMGMGWMGRALRSQDEINRMAIICLELLQEITIHQSASISKLARDLADE